MQIVFHPFATNGQQYVITCSRRDALAVMAARGVDPLDATKRIEATQTKAKISGVAQTVEIPGPRKRDADANVVEAFIYDRFRINPAERLAFAVFYNEFLNSLSPIERQLWSRTRVSRALPAEHPSIAGSSNVRYVMGLSEVA